MVDPALHKIILVVRPTRLDELVARFNTVQQAQFYIEHSGADFSDYLVEHQRYRAVADQAEAVLAQIGRVQRLDRKFLPNFVFGPDDSIVVLGQDGLVANTLKYLDGQRVVGVNPDPARWEGVLLPFTVEDLPRLMPEEVTRNRPVKTVTMAKATLNDGQTMLAVNDLFIGQKTHVSARYTISVGGHTEQHSSSGVIISTGLGSTGWLKSVYAGWASTTRTLLQEPVASTSASFPWNADHLHYYVREPYPSRVTQADIVVGPITASERMALESRMPENGVIFSDGIESDFLEFNSGTHATITIAEKQGILVA